MIQTNNSTVEQKREHPDIYLNKVSNLQSKYIALHVGLFWGIGRFIIKNEDSVTINVDDKTMFDNLTRDEKTTDEFVKTRTNFITHLIDQRKLNIHYQHADSEKNQVSKLL